MTKQGQVWREQSIAVHQGLKFTLRECKAFTLQKYTSCERRWFSSPLSTLHEPSNSVLCMPPSSTDHTLYITCTDLPPPEDPGLIRKNFLSVRVHSQFSCPAPASGSSLWATIHDLNSGNTLQISSEMGRGQGGALEKKYWFIYCSQPSGRVSIINIPENILELGLCAQVCHHSGSQTNRSDYLFDLIALTPNPPGVILKLLPLGVGIFPSHLTDGSFGHMIFSGQWNVGRHEWTSSEQDLEFLCPHY